MIQKLFSTKMSVVGFYQITKIKYEKEPTREVFTSKTNLHGDDQVGHITHTTYDSDIHMTETENKGCIYIIFFEKYIILWMSDTDINFLLPVPCLCYMIAKQKELVQVGFSV